MNYYPPHLSGGSIIPDVSTPATPTTSQQTLIFAHSGTASESQERDEGVVPNYGQCIWNSTVLCIYMCCLAYLFL